jgi:hypothetical protein
VSDKVGGAIVGNDGHYVQILDLSEPERPRVASRLDLPLAENLLDGQPLTLRGDTLYVIVTQQEHYALVAINVTNPYSPVWRNTIPLSMSLSEEVRAVYVAANEENLAIGFVPDWGKPTPTSFFLIASPGGLDDTSIQSLEINQVDLRDLSSSSSGFVARFGTNALVTVSLSERREAPTIHSLQVPITGLGSFEDTILIGTNSRQIKTLPYKKLRGTSVAHSAIADEATGLRSPGGMVLMESEALITDRCSYYGRSPCSEIVAIDLSGPIGSQAPRTVATTDGDFSSRIRGDGRLVMNGRKVFGWIPGENLQLLSSLPDEQAVYQGIYSAGLSDLAGNLAAAAYYYDNDHFWPSWLQIADLTDASNPLVLGRTEGFFCGTAHDLLLQPSVAFLACYGGLAVWQYRYWHPPQSSPGSVYILAARNVVSDGIVAFVLAGGSAWSRVFSISLADMTRPEVVGSVALNGGIPSFFDTDRMVYYQNYLYLATAGTGISIYDVSDPIQFRLYAQLDLPEQINSLAQRYGKIYATSSNGSLLQIIALDSANLDLDWLQ